MPILSHVLLEAEQHPADTIFKYQKGKFVMAEPSILPLRSPFSFEAGSRETILGKWDEELAKYKVNLRRGAQVTAIAGQKGAFVLTLADRSTVNAEAVVLAIGLQGNLRKLGVPGEEQPKVVYRLIDAEQYRGKRVLVVGGGDSALEAALAISEQPGAKAALSYRGDSFGRVKPKNRERLDEATAKRRIEVLLGSNIVEIGATDVTLRQGDRSWTQPNDAVIVCAGGVLPTDLLKKVGVEFETKHGTA